MARHHLAINNDAIHTTDAARGGVVGLRGPWNCVNR